MTSSEPPDQDGNPQAPGNGLPSYGSTPPPMDGHVPPYPGGGMPPQNNQKALVSMILGIVSLICFGLFLGIPAIVLGSIAKKEIDASGGMQTGRGMAQAGIVTGLIAVAWSVVSAVLIATGTVDVTI